MSGLPVLYIIIFLSSLGLSQKLGPYDIIVRTFDFCGPKNGGKDSVNLVTRVRKYNRTTFVVDGDAYMPHDLDDSYKAVIDMAVFTNNGWKDNFFKGEFPEICKQVKAYIWSFFVDITKAVNIPSRCPIKKGNFSLTNYPLSLSMSEKVPMFYYNKYKWTLRVYKIGDPRLRFCIQSILDVVPKKKH